MIRDFRNQLRKNYRLPLLLGGVLILAACDFGGNSWSSRWDHVEINNNFYEEERTAGMGLRKVLSRLAPPKKAVLEPILEAPQLKTDSKAETTETAQEENLIISRRIPLEYGELNFFSTRPNRGRNMHVTQERPAMAEEIEITKVENAEPMQSVQFKPQLEISTEQEAVQNQVEELKKADFLFNEFAKIGK